jgi:hypothetical protein
MKTINITIIEYKDSFPYVQQIINTILQWYRQFAHCYVDDIIIFFKIFEKHIKYLDTIFELFNRIEIIFKDSKIYIDYPSIIFLRQRMNNLNMTCAENRIAAFKNLQFSQILKNLKKYLEMVK